MSGKTLFKKKRQESSVVRVVRTWYCWTVLGHLPLASVVMIRYIHLWPLQDDAAHKRRGCRLLLRFVEMQIGGRDTRPKHYHLKDAPLQIRPSPLHLHQAQDQTTNLSQSNQLSSV